MTKTQKQAEQHARRIEWSVDEAIEYAVALLTECNAHTEAAALQAAAEKKAQEWRETCEREGWTE